MTDLRPVILFDGECNLCHGAVQFVLRRDPHGRFCFAALQGEVARALLTENGLEPPAPGAALDTMFLVDRKRGLVHARSGAALRIAKGLRWPWPLLAICLIVPWPLRDFGYRLVARNRNRLGRRDLCMVPTQGLRERFLD